MSLASSARARLRLVAALLCALATWQLAATVAVGAMTPRPRSCVVPMPCCAKGFCPLHDHGKHAHSSSGPRWLRCDDHVPMSTPPATGPLAVLTRTAGVLLPHFAHSVSPHTALAALSFPREPELPPPQAPAAS